MNNLNAIGLDSQKAQKLAQKLNDLLANYSIFYQNTRGYHWNIKGEKFFELHMKFEELYNDLLGLEKVVSCKSILGALYERLLFIRIRDGGIDKAHSDMKLYWALDKAGGTGSGDDSKAARVADSGSDVGMDLRASWKDNLSARDSSLEVWRLLRIRAHNTLTAEMERDARGARRALEKEVLYVPEARNFPSVDAFILSNKCVYLLQVTVAQEHPVKEVGVRRVLCLFGGKHIDSAVLVFVVPPCKRWFRQRFVKAEAEDERLKSAYGKWTGKLEESELESVPQVFMMVSVRAARRR